MGATEQDPFAIFHTPPVNETAGERVARQEREAEEKRVSDEIDEQLKVDRAQWKKHKLAVRVLLLGQAESGKSTTLKNFRMSYARDDWDAERASWRAVIQLNIVRSIITIVETLQAEMDGDPLEPPPTPNTAFPPDTTDSLSIPTNPSAPVITKFVSHKLSLESLSTRKRTNSVSSLNRHRQPLPLSTPLTAKHQILKERLGPLRKVETDLKRRLGAGAEDEQDGAAEFLGPLSLEVESQGLAKKSEQEFSVRTLKEALERSAASSPTGDPASTPQPTSMSNSAVDEATDILASCKDDMKALWTDEVVRVVLRKRKLKLQDSAGFYLDDLDRIVDTNYEPSDDDVIRARLRTIGVQEYRINIEESTVSTSILSSHGDVGKQWFLYDVGGSRTLRHKWIPYFDNMQAIIFLAPVSCFDERLTEDSKVNRLEDSFLLWKHICSSKLLAKSTMILFLNKCDLLKRKLRAGIEVKKYLPSFGDRENDPSVILKYLREKFKDVLKEYSPEPRASYFYATSVVDTKATGTTIKAVRDSILRDYLRCADLM